MKKPNIARGPLWPAIGLLLAAGVSLRAAADLPMHYQAQSTNTSVAIQGTSTVHDWEMKGPIIGGFVDFPANVNFDTNQATLPGLKDGLLPAGVTARITIRSIRSEADHLPEVMDRLMREAMKETNYPRIEYHVTELKLQQPHVAGQPFAFDAKGSLAIAGVTNKVAFPVTIVPLGKDKIIISGTAKLKMTDFKIDPPAPNFGLGLMKCGDDIKIVFQWTLMYVPPKQP
jgi:polyisoprenoid-binding protein YceI